MNEETELIEEGAEAPDFTLPDQDGEDVTLSGLRGRPVGSSRANRTRAGRGVKRGQS